MNGRVHLGSSGILSAGKWLPLRTLVWLLGLAVLVVVAYNLVGKGSTWVLVWAAGKHFTSFTDIPESYKLCGVLVGAFAALLAYACAVRWGERREVTELSLRKLPSEYLAGGIIGAIEMGAIITILIAAGWAVIAPADVTAIARALKETVQSSTIEELLFRLVIFRLLWRATGVWPALLLSMLFFGGGHLVNPHSSWLAAVSIMLSFGLETGLYMLTGRIWASMGAHAAWNFTQGWIFGATVSGLADISGGPLSLHPARGIPDALSGGQFGPEASVGALFVSAVVSVAILLLVWKRDRFQSAADNERRAAG